MKDYIVWAAEEMEQRWDWDFYEAQEYLMSGNHIPSQVSVEAYIAACKEEKENECKS